jgi:hypothetical protein
MACRFSAGSFDVSIEGHPLFLQEQITMATNTVRLHRVLRTPPDRLYRAFVEPSAFERWLPPFGFTGKVHTMEPVVGGAWRMSFTNFGTGHSHSFGGKYLELLPHKTAVSCGTEMSVVQEGIPDVIPVEMCYLGWQESLVALAQLVEPNIPG